MVSKIKLELRKEWQATKNDPVARATLKEKRREFNRLRSLQGMLVGQMSDEDLIAEPETTVTRRELRKRGLL
jgi:hypothetical protein